MKGTKVKKAAVLGAGIMGSRIAALLAGVDIPTYLLDIVPGEPDEQDKKKGLTVESPEFRSKLARTGIQGTIGARPPAMYVPEDAGLITPGNFEDHLHWLSDADWIIEAVAEDLEIKKELLRKVEPHLKPGAILSTNTSGLSIERISEELPEGIKARFLGTHFFNPPRHMKLLEIIPGRLTEKEVLAFVAEFCEVRLGKSIVFAKDTPNFIANRIGAHAVIGVMNTMVEDRYTIEEADAITGPPMGRPKSASFRTSDMVGLDTFIKVAQNVCDNIEGEEEKRQLAVPEFVKQMVERGLLGDKTQMGFYKKVLGTAGSEIHALDYNTMDYVPQRKVALPVLDELRKVADPAARLHTLVNSEEKAGSFAWKVLKRMLPYCAARVPEIADDIVSIDRAMRWGFNWDLGPFETWDAIGLRASVERMEKEGERIPDNIERMLASGRERFYEKRDGQRYYYDFGKADYEEIETKPQIIILPSIKERAKLVRSNAGASLVDMGDGVVCLEFNSPNNAIDPDVIQMISESVAEVEENFEGLVIGNQGTNFCVGADLKQIFPATQNKDWDSLELATRNFQQACMRIKYSEKPVLAAPFRMTLGGGCEVCMAASMIRAHAEAYMGLVEFGVGLIPSGGGNKELMLRAVDWVPPSVPSAVPGGGKPDIIPYVARIFETIAMAKVSTCAREALELDYLRPHDMITMNQDHLLYDAKQSALALAREGYRPPRPRNEIRVTGRTGRAILELIVYLMRGGEYITDHDAHIAKKLAYVLTGGDVDQDTLVTEEYLLDLEREAFLSLCGEEKTQARMKHMLETNRPLRN
ncbi:MAG TPA: 3-hydroxyacyl-CoA dehydrogenase [Dehalococcoidia bacterium]|nr:3-hydroxyacyl-CoA dehydrogenase [Dehalococcoidia bacterium]